MFISFLTFELLSNKMTMIVYRSFKLNDYYALIALWKLSGLPVKLEGRDSRIEIEKELQRGCAEFILAEDNSKLIGAIIATHDGRKGWLNRLAIHPDYRKQGIGKELVKRAEDHLTNIGIGIFACLIEDYNTTSLEVFQKLGYIRFEGIQYLTKRKYPEI